MKDALFLLDPPFGLFYTLPVPKEILIRFFRHIESYSYIDLKWEIQMEGIRPPHFSRKKWGFLLALICLLITGAPFNAQPAAVHKAVPDQVSAGLPAKAWDKVRQTLERRPRGRPDGGTGCPDDPHTTKGRIAGQRTGFG